MEQYWIFDNVECVFIFFVDEKKYFAGFDVSIDIIYFSNFLDMIMINWEEYVYFDE